jgi:hypothetical protein
MTSEAQQQLFRLSAFVQARWPQLQADKEAVINQPMAAAGWIEALFWLQLGVRFNAYPTEAALDLMRLSRPSLELIIAKYQSKWEGVFPTIFDKDYILPDALHGPNPSLTSSQNFGSPLSHFQIAFHLSNLMNRDSLGLTFRQLLAFEDKAAWKGLIEGPCSVDVVNRWLTRAPENVIPVTELIIAGFFRCVDSMVSWKLFFENLLEDSHVSHQDRLTLKRNIGLITCWTINFHIDSIKERFLQVADLTATLMSDVAHFVQPNVVINTEVFRNSINDLVNDWQLSHPQHLYNEGIA